MPPIEECDLIRAEAAARAVLPAIADRMAATSTTTSPDPGVATPSPRA